jgi:T-complex protein 1 subunit beta
MLELCADAVIIAMDTDKIKIFGARVRVDGTGKLAELERAEKVCNRARIDMGC